MAARRRWRRTSSRVLAMRHRRWQLELPLARPRARRTAAARRPPTLPRAGQAAAAPPLARCPAPAAPNHRHQRRLKSVLRGTWQSDSSAAGMTGLHGKGRVIASSESGGEPFVWGPPDPPLPTSRSSAGPATTGGVSGLLRTSPASRKGNLGVTCVCTRPRPVGRGGSATPARGGEKTPRFRPFTASHGGPPRLQEGSHPPACPLLTINTLFAAPRVRAGAAEGRRAR
jgi:hypothetical protein